MPAPGGECPTRGFGDGMTPRFGHTNHEGSALALFGKKNEPEEAASGPDDAAGFSPEKAARFFAHAKTVHDTANYEYAIQSWLSGLRRDPSSMTGLEGFFVSIASFMQEGGGKKGVGKEIVKSVSGKGDVDRYLASLVEWGQKPDDAVLAVRAMEAAAKLGQGMKAPVLRIGEIAAARVLADKRVRKDLLARLSQGFEKAGAFDKAVLAAEHAYKVDPTDGEMSARIRALAAQATMARGGYANAGQEGGFRANIRDADKQRQLEDADRIVKTEETIDRLIAEAKVKLTAHPQDLPSIEKLAKLYLERGTPSDEEAAYAVYTKAYRDTKQFRFREFAGDIRIRQKKRQAGDLRKMLDESGGDDMVARMSEQAEADLLKLELDEYTLRVENYPTDLLRKFELGKRCFAAGQNERAIELFQEAQSDPKNRTASLLMLGQSFARQGWMDEAIETFRRALESRELTSDQSLELRYHLMSALQTRATETRDLSTAEEAEKLAASIAVEQIGYRDIRARRDGIKKLTGELRAARQG